MEPWEIEINESVQERIDRDGWEALSRPERLYSGVWWLLFVAYGPGFDRYFAFTSKDSIQAAREGLREIAARGMLAILDEARELLPWQDHPREEGVREAKIREMTEEQLEKLHELCSRFTDEPYPEELLDSYALQNDSSFTGPRTALDLWHSKVARGVDTTPKYVSKEMDFEREAEADRPHSSRSCPNCGYPTPDYRPTCKRCDYPHGRAKT